MNLTSPSVPQPMGLLVYIAMYQCSFDAGSKPSSSMDIAPENRVRQLLAILPTKKPPNLLRGKNDRHPTIRKTDFSDASSIWPNSPDCLNHFNFLIFN
jgi:hypothetical protein